MLILGISAFYHDSAVALIKDGDIIYAAQEERFSRKKHDHSFPEKALKNALEYTGYNFDNIDAVVFYEKPFLKFDRLMSTYMQFAPKGVKSFIQAMPVWFKEKLFIKHLIQEKTGKDKIFFTKHHESHAAAAFYPSPFKKAAIITVDGVGEWDTLTIGRGNENKIIIEKTIEFPHSLGLLYSAFTYFTGFRVNSGEYKLMGLAPYGEPIFVNKIYDNLIDVKQDGSFRLNMDYFNFHTGLTMTNTRFSNLFNSKPRKPETSIRQIDMDLAASVQVVLEETMEKIVKHTKKIIGGDNLVLAGGVALNCVANGKILKKQIFKNIWIQPAAGDAGGALGAAYYYWYNYLGNQRKADNINDAQKGSFLGPAYSNNEIKTFLEKNNIKYVELKENEIPDKVADLIEKQKVIGIFHGRMEFGPRALGHRSIIGDARSKEMQKIMNLKIKFRESFRPFAPSVIEEKTGEYFDYNYPSRYMLLVYNIKKEKRKVDKKIVEKQRGLKKLDIEKSDIPAITHVDFSARVHSVDSKTNNFFYKIINSFYKKTGCPVVINTSFNVRGEPIVNNPEDAYKCFKNTNMDYLLLENYLIKKTGKIEIDENWIKNFPLD